jgi:hypothetical protein
VQASSSSPWSCQWYLSNSNLLNCGTNCQLTLTNVQLSQSGDYTAVIANAAGVSTSAPAMLNVISPVERRPVPAIYVNGGAGSSWEVDYADSISSTLGWTSLASVDLSSVPQVSFDLTQPLPSQRFYRARQMETPGLPSSLNLHLVPAITLTGNLGDTWRVDSINQFGPINAWATLATVTLTNAAELYFDISAVGQPPRLYRLAQVP